MKDYTVYRTICKRKLATFDWLRIERMSLHQMDRAPTDAGVKRWCWKFRAVYRIDGGLWRYSCLCYDARVGVGKAGSTVYVPGFEEGSTWAALHWLLAGESSWRKANVNT